MCVLATYDLQKSSPGGDRAFPNSDAPQDRGMEKKNVLPSPTVDSSQMRPPRCSTMFLTIASPAPVPSNISRG